MDIIIIGAGTFGLSTGVQLLRKGQKVTLIDSFPVPSPISAGNDVNKILQSSVADEFYSELALEALDLWRNDPVYKPAFHETGIVYTSSSDFGDLDKRKKFLEEKGIKFTELKQAEDFAKLVPSAVESDIDRFAGWEGYYQSENCGWTFAAKALESARDEIIRLGGKFITDSVEEILYDDSDAVAGVRTAKSKYTCEKVVLCAGAQSYKFLDFEGQLLAKCWTVAHVRLSDDEAKRLKNIPVVLNLDQGFFFEPDRNNDLKLCNEFPGYINLSDSEESVPLYRNEVPKEAEIYLRKFLKQVFPTLSTRPFSVAKICWCTDTTDRHFLIGTHPDHKGLILGTGDSGQGFKYMPNVGKYISEVAINGDEALDPVKREAWKWRPEQAANRNKFELQSRSGGTNLIKDLKDISEWTDGVDVDLSVLKI